MTSKPLAYKVDGRGEPLLLLNGIAMTMVGWAGVSRLLERSCTVLRCDFRGQLRTPGPVPDNVADHANDAVRLLDWLGMGPVHVLGTSFGGLVAVYLASRYPDRVRSLTVVASADRFDDTMTAEVSRWRRACRRSVEAGDHGHLVDVMAPVVYSSAFREKAAAVLRSRRESMARLPVRWFEDLDRLMASTEGVDLSEELPRIQCPTTVAAASVDGLIPISRCRALAAGIPGAVFTVLDNVGHAAVIEQPDRVAALVLETMRRSAQ